MRKNCNFSAIHHFVSFQAPIHLDDVPHEGTLEVRVQNVPLLMRPLLLFVVIFMPLRRVLLLTSFNGAVQ